MIKVKRGSRVFYSEIGHKGFHYPSNSDSFLITEEVEINPLTWIAPSNDTRIPVTITLPDDPVRVVWVKKEDLLS